MSGGKETPRQKMIGMMYLFLTAMLAINVSSEVLDAFTIVDAGFAKTINTFDTKNKQVYNEFNEAYDINPSKVKNARNSALEIQRRSDSLYNHIQSLKWMIVKKSDGEEADMNNLKKKGDLDLPTEVMIVGGNGKILKSAIKKHKEYILSLVNKKDSTIRNTILKTLDTSDPPMVDGATRTWESLRFSNVPLAGAITLMSKMQLDIRNTESDIINYLYNQIEAESYKFNKLSAEVIAPSNYILKGDEYEAKIILVATDTTIKPKIYLNSGQKITEFTNDQKGVYRVKPNKLGHVTWGGFIRYVTPSKLEKKLEFSSEYVVAEPNVVISPTKMNVFYVGVDNPVSISVSGVSSDRLRPKMTNGKIIKKGSSYIVKPGVSGKVARISVEAKFKDEYRLLKSVDFRVKPVPDPIPMVGGKKGGSIKKNLLLVQTGVDAVMEGFDFDLEFKITGFNVSTIVKGFTRDETSRSDAFTQDQLNLIKNLNRNQKIYIEDIRAVGPDGVTRKLPTISFRIE